MKTRRLTKREVAEFHDELMAYYESPQARRKMIRLMNPSKRQIEQMNRDAEKLGQMMARDLAGRV